MSTLVVVGYDEPFKADEVLLKLRKLQREYLLDLEDAAVAIKDEHGKVKLHQTLNLTAAGAASGGFWGSLIGLIFLNPLMGFAVGAATGAISGALTDVGIDDNFMKDLAATMTPNSSTLFVLVRKSTPDKVLDELTGRPDFEDIALTRGRSQTAGCFERSSTGAREKIDALAADVDCS
jgi:uncharacterized membrane protein